MRAILLAALLLMPATGIQAQGTGAALVADSVVLTEDGRLVASGNVEAFFEGTTLSASRVTYDREADRLLVEGEILLRDAEGTILTAERADLDPRLEQGLLQGARLVLDRQLQIAATQAARREGLTTLDAVAATSCQVCPGRRPLWEIRAERVVRDETAEVLTFQRAQFLVRGVPILWFPAIRLPEPGNERATGFLLPNLRASDELGFGVELPLFLELGPSRDLTLTPFLSSASATLETRYRQAFLNGEIEATGAITRDDLMPGMTRSYLSAQGRFELQDGTELAFAGLVASDGDYASDYALAEGEALESRLGLTNVGASSLLEGGLSLFQDLDRSDREDVPVAAGDLSWNRRAALGAGTLTWGATIDVVRRRASEPPGDTARLGTYASWQLREVLRAGLVVESGFRLGTDAFLIQDLAHGDEVALRSRPEAAVSLRWPLVRSGGEVADLVEPLAMLSWSSVLGEKRNTVGDALQPEFYETSFSPWSRPTRDEPPDGGSLGLGLAWTRVSPSYSSSFLVGRSIKLEGSDHPTAWLLTGLLQLPQGLAVEGRTQLDHDGSLSVTEARIDWSNAMTSIAASYARVEAERPDPGEEVSLDTEFRPSEHWSVRTEARYDLDDDQARRLALGLGWRNECVEVDVSLARSYTSADGRGSSTEFGLSIGLLGFSTVGEAGVAPGACRSGGRER